MVINEKVIYLRKFFYDSRIFNIRNFARTFFKQKAIIITGPRQSGKTTLLNLIIEKLNTKSLFLNCDEPDIRKKLENVTSTQLNKLLGNYKIVCIDEAQRVENIGLTLKLYL